MENKIKNLLQFYLLATELKDKIRSGWKVWNIDRQRIESVAEHIYGTCILAISIDSQFELDIDLYKVIIILVLHEIEEIKIGDLTPFDKVTKEEKRKIGKQAVEEVLSTLDKKVQYIELIEEFENMKTNESMFAKMCDKLEADIQCKLYCEEKSIDINKKENGHLLNDARIEKLLNNGEKTVADLFIENDRPIYTEKIFEEIANYMLLEPYFPYVLFLEGSNFLTHDITIERPDGRKVTLTYNAGNLNRLDRLTAANYGMPINTNLCENRFVACDGLNIMLQAVSIFAQKDGERWKVQDMVDVMVEVAKTSLKMLGKDLFKQLTSNT